MMLEQANKFISGFVHTSILPSVCRSVHQSVRPSIRPSDCPMVTSGLIALLHYFGATKQDVQNYPQFLLVNT